MMVGDSLWAIVVVLGFVVLAGAIMFAKLRGKQTPQQERRTEDATARMYKEQAAEDDVRTP